MGFGGHIKENIQIFFLSCVLWRAYKLWVNGSQYSLSLEKLVLGFAQQMS